MKKLFRNTSHSKLFAFVLSACFCTHAFGASAVAVVSSLTGRAFVSVDGRTTNLKQGDQIAAFSEVFTEVGAQVTLSDYFDHKYHLAGSGHLQFINKSVQLKEGYLWVQSFNDRHTFNVQTANAVADFKRGEGIISFDSYTGRSQLLVKKGEWHYKNSMNEYLSQTVSEGQFSFIHMEQDDGAPRPGTPIGYHSYNQIVALFKNIGEPTPTLQLGVAPSRDIASVPSAPSAQARTLEMAPSHDVKPAARPTVDPAMEAELKNLYAPKLAEKKPAPKKWKPSYEQKSAVEVKIFGAPKKKATQRVPASTSKPALKSRTPASVGGMAPVIKADAFESKLMQEYKNQMRHSSETNKLINELKSFDQDYIEGY